jgi:hypothetical protein
MWTSFGNVIQIEAWIDFSGRIDKGIPNAATSQGILVGIRQNWERYLWRRELEIFLVVIGKAALVCYLVHALQESFVEIEHLAPVLNVGHHDDLLLIDFVS